MRKPLKLKKAAPKMKKKLTAKKPVKVAAKPAAPSGLEARLADEEL